MRLVSAQRKDPDADSAVWRARVDLAAARQLADIQGFSEGIFNHFTFAAPGTDDRYLQIPFGLHWSAVTASCFMEIGVDGQVLSGTAGIENLPVQLV